MKKTEIPATYEKKIILKPRSVMPFYYHYASIRNRGIGLLRLGQDPFGSFAIAACLNEKLSM